MPDQHPWTPYDVALARADAAPFVSLTELESETGWSVSIIDGAVMLTHPDPRRLPITNPETVRRFVLNNTPSGRRFLAARAQRIAAQFAALAEALTHNTTTTKENSEP